MEEVVQCVSGRPFLLLPCNALQLLLEDSNGFSGQMIPKIDFICQLLLSGQMFLDHQNTAPL